MATTTLVKERTGSQGGLRLPGSDETRAGWTMLTPWIVGFLVFTLTPFAASLFFSFTKYDMIRPAQWIGLQNYRRLLTSDTLFPLALKNTFVYTILYVPLHLITALGVALLLNEARRAKGIFRTAFYLPSMTPAVATAYLWLWILNPNDGLMNRFLRFLHLPAPGWTIDPNWTKPTIVIAELWMMGGAMILFLAALQGVPKDLYEAATIDGAGRIRRFRDVTLPMISGVTFFLATVDTIAALNVFTQGYVMFNTNGTDYGGPSNSVLFIVTYLYKRAFGSGFFQMGYASAIAWLLFLIVLVVTLLQFWGSKKWVYYEADAR